MILPVIIAWEAVSRLWQLSNNLMPKQFLKLDDDNTMLQETVQYFQGLDTLSRLVIFNEGHRFIATEQIRQINQLDHNIILDPLGRNTLPAIALAAMTAIKNEQDPLLLVLAADNIVADSQEFRQVVTVLNALKGLLS